jgi:hypothetical protein
VKGRTLTSLFLHESSWHCSWVGAVFTFFGYSLIWQTHRWLGTPAYVNILKILPGPAWGALYLVVGVALLVSVRLVRHNRWPMVFALIAAQVITAVWLINFVIRWATSSTTTPLTWGTYLIILGLLFRALMLVDLGRLHGLR